MQSMHKEKDFLDTDVSLTFEVIFGECLAVFLGTSFVYKPIIRSKKRK